MHQRKDHFFELLFVSAFPTVAIAAADSLRAMFDSQLEYATQDMEPAEDWILVADREVDSQLDLEVQIADAEKDAGGSDDAGGEEDVFDRVRRFKASRPPFDDGCPLNDPYWISPFNDALETIEANIEHSAGIKKQLDREIYLLSGCSGMCAEGWVSKARKCKTKTKVTGVIDTLDLP